MSDGLQDHSSIETVYHEANALKLQGVVFQLCKMF